MNSRSASVLYDVPGPRARARYRLFGVLGVLGIAALLWWIVAVLADKGQFDGWLWRSFEYKNVQQRIVDGALATLKAFALGAVGSLVLGVLLAVGRLSDHRPVRVACTAVVQFFRAMPLLIMIFALYTAVFTAQPLWALVLGLSVYNGAVQAEIIRSGINAVPRGQGEAGYALGLRKTQVMTLVLLPQSVRAMLPAIIGQLVVTLKDTSLGYIITYPELLFVGRWIASNSDGYPYIPVILVITPLYIAMCLALSGLARWIESRGRRGARARGTAAA
ncbi:MULTISPECIES: amino acid ABC transporter permease [Kitasatospora]|uniref:Putative glutamate ABC transporter permease protein n=1 Tax=Kitasatospora setae (strain ATCC 33774 / DSM 43861 / JCM 3304 / KCC A-0304 / NBRC 14216 / KM-6054) TaxID=452652 RepID=E4NI08_KITSK|nr:MULTISPECIES: amino acid ABC transporter permease [Kitasatospora]BAJ31138.1 putative glutamate ABC transporter permease protein [Kitasatospora setae KM-6054]